MAGSPSAQNAASRRLRQAALLWLALPALAQPTLPAGWLDSPAAADFRLRVVDLAVLYEESAGIDPQGLKVVTRRISTLPEGCFRVEAITLDGERQLRRDEVTACRKAASP